MKAVLFDNAGGVTLVFGSWCHTYQSMREAAEDFILIESGEDAEVWEGNEMREMEIYLQRGDFEKDFSIDEFGEFSANCENMEEIPVLSMREMVAEIQKIKSQQ